MTIKEMKEPWGESIVSEHQDLKEKYSHLIDYINSEEFYKLSSNTKKIITNQKVLMESYINNLSMLLYENVDTIFIQDYSMLGLFFNAISGGFNSSFSNTNSTTELKEFTDKTSIKNNEE